MGEQACRILKKAVQQGRSERRPEAYPLGYVEDLSDARTPLADFFSILLELEIGVLGDGEGEVFVAFFVENSCSRQCAECLLDFSIENCVLVRSVSQQCAVHAHCPVVIVR